MKKQKIFSATVQLAERSPDALYSRMRLAKGFFLPFFVAEIDDLPLPSTIGPPSDRHDPEVLPSFFDKEKSLFRFLSAFSEE